MPRVAIEVPELEESITRPVAIQVIRQMAEQARLDPHIPVRYLNNSLSLLTPGTAIDDPDFKNRFPGDQRIVIEATEQYDENYALGVPVMRPDSRFVFSDQELDIHLKPVYQRVVVTVDVKITGSDKTSVTTWLTRLKRKHAQGAAERIHHVDYHYPIPMWQINALAKMHDMREAVAGLGEDFAHWLKRCFDDKFSVIFNQAGNNPQFVIRETQTEVLGWFDFNSQPPKADKENDVNSWTAGFTYTFCYDRPESVVMVYPLMIHNQILDNAYYNDVKPEEVEDIIAYAGLATTAYSNFTFKSRGSYAFNAKEGIPIPHFDDWLPRIEHPTTANLMRMMLQTNPDSPKEIVCLDNLGAWSFRQIVANYMRDVHYDLSSIYESAFHVQLHRGYDPQPESFLTITPDLNVYSLYDLTLTKPYHLTVSVVTDLTKLSTSKLATLAKHGEMTLMLLLAFDPTLSVKTHDLDQMLYDYRVYQLSQAKGNPPSDGINEFQSGIFPAGQSIAKDGSVVVRGGDLFTSAIYLQWLDTMNKTRSLKEMTTKAPVLPTLLADGSVDLDELLDAIGYIKRNRYLERSTYAMKWRPTVQTLIIPHRSQEYAAR